MERLERILNKADELGMAVIVGYFYFGQDERLTDEAAVIRATDRATQWLLDRGYQNVLVEINNECNVRYDHEILKPERVHELIERVKHFKRNGRRLPAGTSYGGGTIPRENVVRAADFLLLHGNGISDPDRIAEMVRETRAVRGYSAKPILFNEDDHFNFEEPKNNFVAALSEHASWGYFDPGTNNYADGYQSPPVNWGLNTERKRSFFELLGKITFDRKASGNSVAVSIRQVNYHGWSNSFLLSNGKAEIAIVPAIGRVMQFGFLGEEGVFWENRSLDGQALDTSAENWRKTDWINFGGDKTWPSPEGDWSKYTRRQSWRPPPAFDAMPVEARVEGEDLILISPVDPFLGVLTLRRVHLDPKETVMTIRTRYEKLTGDPVKIGVWVITQLKNPAGIYAPVTDSAPLRYAKGYAMLGKEPPPDLYIKDWDSGFIEHAKHGYTGNVVHRWFIYLSRDRKVPHKIGTDGGTLLWIGDKTALRIDSWRVSGKEYPDQGSSAEIYTNPDPLKYVELEMLGPVQTMHAGDQIERVNAYTLLRRSKKKPDMEARKIFSEDDRR